MDNREWKFPKPLPCSPSSTSYSSSSISHPLFYRTFAFVAIKINLLCNNHGFITRTASPCSTFRHITFFYDFLCAQRLLLDVFYVCVYVCVCVFSVLFHFFFFSLTAKECRCKWRQQEKKKKTFLMVSSKSNWVTRKYTVEVKKLKIK